MIRGIRTTTPARTAFDLGRRRGLTTAVIRVDALLQASDLKLVDVQPLLARHKGVRGVVQLREILDLADDGAESPPNVKKIARFSRNLAIFFTFAESVSVRT